MELTQLVSHSTTENQIVTRCSIVSFNNPGINVIITWPFVRHHVHQQIFPIFCLFYRCRRSLINSLFPINRISHLEFHLDCIYLFDSTLVPAHDLSSLVTCKCGFIEDSFTWASLTLHTFSYFFFCSTIFSNGITSNPQMMSHSQEFHSTVCYFFSFFMQIEL